MLITTTDILQGKEIKEYIGLVYVIKPDRCSVGSGDYEDKQMTATMEPLIDALQNEGVKLGADAIIGVRFTIENHYIRAFGTAVKCK